MSERSTSTQPEDLSKTLEALLARVDSWREQRAAIIREIRSLNELSGKLLEELGTGPVASSTGGAVRARGGRPKGYRASAATRAKLRAAWKRRKGHGNAAPKRRLSAEARERIAAAQRKRWAATRKQG